MKESKGNFENSILPWLGRTMKMIDYFIADKMKANKMHLSKQQWIVLKVLFNEDGKPQNDLAFITNRDKGSLARLLNTMESKNLVARIPSKKDRRINEIYLTKHGEQVLVESFPVFEEIINELEQGLNDTQIKTVVDVLKKVQNNINVSELVAVETK